MQTACSNFYAFRTRQSSRFWHDDSQFPFVQLIRKTCKACLDWEALNGQHAWRWPNHMVEVERLEPEVVMMTTRVTRGSDSCNDDA
jgi:hypothetical protein